MQYLSSPQKIINILVAFTLFTTFASAEEYGAIDDCYERTVAASVYGMQTGDKTLSDQMFERGVLLSWARQIVHGTSIPNNRLDRKSYRARLSSNPAEVESLLTRCNPWDVEIFVNDFDQSLRVATMCYASVAARRDDLVETGQISGKDPENPINNLYARLYGAWAYLAAHGSNTINVGMAPIGPLVPIDEELTLACTELITFANIRFRDAGLSNAKPGSEGTRP
jgi:hypothetical protein